MFAKCCLAALALSLLLGTANAFADGLPGEVGTNEAYIVRKNCVVKEEGRFKIIRVEITTTIKVKQAGRYYVVAGFLKSDKWLRGLISGADYFTYREINLGAGDEIEIRLNPPWPPIGGKRIWDVGIYRSLTDMQHYR